jgi:hypothetical protein
LAASTPRCYCFTHYLAINGSRTIWKMAAPRPGINAASSEDFLTLCVNSGSYDESTTFAKNTRDKCCQGAFPASSFSTDENSFSVEGFHDRPFADLLCLQIS